MRSMPQLQDGAKSTLMTSAFFGLNKNEIIADGELHDMTNLSGSGYPLLTLRKKRGISNWNLDDQPIVPLSGIHGRDQLVHVRGDTVYYNLAAVQGISVSTAENMCPKKIVSMGAYVCIWPDLVYFNTANLSDRGYMYRRWQAEGDSLSMIMCRNDGTDYDMTNITIDDDPPENPVDKQLWLDQSGTNDVLRQYSALTQEWVEVASTFVKISGTGIGTGLKEYDCIDLSGLELAGEDPDPKLYAQVQILNASTIIYGAGDDYIIIAGLLSNAIEAGDLKDNTVHADLNIPDMDYVVESNNRLWGCKYGLVDGQVLNEIYASKLGDFRNWRCYMNLSTDSYTASVGTDGPWTGAITQRGYPVFFKENAIHRVSGQQPSSFSIQTTICRGVQRGSYRSLAVVGENVYYKSRDGIMLYDGNMPVKVSDNLGNDLYSDARAGVLGDNYYISMKDNNGAWSLFVYDTKHNQWWREDNTQALGFGTAEDELYFIDEKHNTLVSVRGTLGTVEEDPLEWSAEFDLYGVNYVSGGNYDSPARVRNEKYISMFKIRMSMAEGAEMTLYIRYDNGKWEKMGTRKGTGLGTFVLPVVPKRCDHIRFLLMGEGDMTIYSISRIMEVGGDG